MAEHLYEVAMTKTTSTAAAPFAEIIPATLAAGKRPPEIREIGVFVVSPPSSGGAEIGIGRPAAIGITPATEVTVTALDSIDTITGNTVIAATWGTAPTAPTTFMRRAELQGIAGAGLIFTWLPGEFVLWSGSAISTVVLWQLGALAVTYDVYLKVAE